MVERIEALYPECENRVAARGLQIEFMRCIDSVFESRLEEMHQVLLVLTLKHKQVLYAELLILVPAQPQALLACPRVTGCVK